MSKRAAPCFDSLEDVIEDLKNSNSFLASQVKAGLGVDEVQDAMFHAWKSKLEQIEAASMLDRTALSDALDSGPWSTDQKTTLARVLSAIGGGGKPPKRRSMQKCPHFENFITEASWAKIRSPLQYSRVARCAAIATEAKRAGLHNPDEPTLYRMVAVLAYGDPASSDDFTQLKVFDTMDELQTMVKSGKPSDVPYISEYPTSPSQLPDIFNDVYVDGMPLEVSIPELDIILGTSKMRGRTGSPDWIKHIPLEYQQTVLTELMDARRPYDFNIYVVYLHMHTQ